MFPIRYFPVRYFAPRYFPAIGATTIPPFPTVSTKGVLNMRGVVRTMPL